MAAESQFRVGEDITTLAVLRCFIARQDAQEMRRRTSIEVSTACTEYVLRYCASILRS